MHIEHVALWTNTLETLKDFYCDHFGAQAGERYENPGKGFASYFLSFPSGARLELMQMPSIRDRFRSETEQDSGYIHLAFATGSKAAVNRLTDTLAAHGHPCLEAPHTTGDGYYESTVLDPDGNRIEITV